MPQIPDHYHAWLLDHNNGISRRLPTPYFNQPAGYRAVRKRELKPAQQVSVLSCPFPLRECPTAAGRPLFPVKQPTAQRRR